jgi:hypothetical protein
MMNKPVRLCFPRVRFSAQARLQFAGWSLFGPPLAKGASAPRRGGKIIRPRITGRRHAKTGHIVVPLKQAVLDSAFRGGGPIFISWSNGLNPLMVAARNGTVEFAK